MGHSPGFGSPHKSVKAQWQPWRVESRQHDQDVSIVSLRSTPLPCPAPAPAPAVQSIGPRCYHLSLDVSTVRRPAPVKHSPSQKLVRCLGH